MKYGNELYAEKANEELKSRIKWFEEALKDEKKKNELHDNILGSEILIRLEIFLPSDNPEIFIDGLYLYINNEGQIIDAEYYFRDSHDGTITRLSEDNFNIVKELFEDSFSLEIE